MSELYGMQIPSELKLFKKNAPFSSPKYLLNQLIFSFPTVFYYEQVTTGSQRKWSPGIQFYSPLIHSQNVLSPLSL